MLPLQLLVLLQIPRKQQYHQYKNDGNDGHMDLKIYLGKAGTKQNLQQVVAHIRSSRDPQRFCTEPGQPDCQLHGRVAVSIHFQGCQHLSCQKYDPHIKHIGQEIDKIAQAEKQVCHSRTLRAGHETGHDRAAVHAPHVLDGFQEIPQALSEDQVGENHIQKNKKLL